jgi:uroporphyrinogen III methyltransferase/synthase
MAAESEEKYQIAVQGRGTGGAVAKLFGREPGFTPTVFVAEDFAREFMQRLRSEDRILVAQSADGRDVVAPYLTEKGLDVTVLRTYETVAIVPPHSLVDELVGGVPDETIFVFMSPSAVQATVRALGSRVEFLAESKIISVGPITSQAIRIAGFSQFREASEYSEEGVMALLP